MKELDRLSSAFGREQEHFKKHPKEAAAVVGGDGKPDQAELAAWTMIANVLFNLDETITKE